MQTSTTSIAETRETGDSDNTVVYAVSVSVFCAVVMLLLAACLMRAKRRKRVEEDVKHTEQEVAMTSAVPTVTAPEQAVVEEIQQDDDSQSDEMYAQHMQTTTAGAINIDERHTTVGIVTTEGADV